MNKLYEQMNGNMFGNSEQLFQRVQQLKAQMGGDPNQHIQRMLNSGKITQDEYNRAVQKAQQLRMMLGK